MIDQSKLAIARDGELISNQRGGNCPVRQRMSIMHASEVLVRRRVSLLSPATKELLAAAGHAQLDVDR